MLEHVHIRINKHQFIGGVNEYSVEVAIPGKYARTIIGASQQELTQSVSESFRQIFTLVGIPETIIRPEQEQIEQIEQLIFGVNNPIFLDEKGKPQSGFAATAKATFQAQVIRNGKVVED